MTGLLRTAFYTAAATLITSSAAAAPGAPTNYTLDAAKSSLEFTFTQAGAQNKGHFGKFTVQLNFADDNLAASKLDVAIVMASEDTDDKDRDDTLRGADLFNVAKFPQAHFAAAPLTKTATGYEAAGQLTLRDVTRALRVPLTLRSATEQGKRVIYLTGKTAIKRLDFGVGQGDWKETGGEGVGNDVGIAFNLRLVGSG